MSDENIISFAEKVKNINTKKASFLSEAVPFFGALFSTVLDDKSGQIELRTFPKHRTHYQDWFDDETKAAEKAYELCKQGIDVYFSVNPKTEGGKKENIPSVVTFHAEVDFGAAGHKKKSKWKDDITLLKALCDFSPSPSYSIYSGGGFHVYWILKEPYKINSKADIDLIEGLNLTLTKLLGGDPGTQDISRVLRVPGSTNYKLKNNPRPVCVVHSSSNRYTVDEMRKALFNRHEENPANHQVETINPDIMSKIMSACEFIKKCFDNPDEVSEPQWHAVISNVALLEPDGRELCHELSRGYSGYTEEETNLKVDRALQNAKPHTCDTINEKLDFTCSRRCKFKAPLVKLKHVINERGFELDLEVRKLPVLSEKALVGIAGEFVELATHHSEADKAAVLATFLTRFSVEVSRGPCFWVGDSKHYARLMTVIVGNSSKARKGTSSTPVERLFNTSSNYPDYEFARTSPGPLSSGEGLIYNVRDEQKEWKVTDKKTGEMGLVVTDPGITDKRLFIRDEELAAALACTKREGNTLSVIIRQFWDSGTLEPLTKTNRCSCTGAHVGIVAHITIKELLDILNEIQVFNGFANRLLWVFSRRKKLISRPQPMPNDELANFQGRIIELCKKVWGTTTMTFSEDALNMWDEVYPELSKEHLGLSGVVCNRAEVQTIRIAMIYALLDGETVIRPHHLEAALAFWQYCEDSALFIFGGRESDIVADKIIEALKDGDLTSTEINELFSHNVQSARIKYALQELAISGKITSYKDQEPNAKGRPTIRYTLLKDTELTVTTYEKNELNELNTSRSKSTEVSINSLNSFNSLHSSENEKENNTGNDKKVSTKGYNEEVPESFIKLHPCFAKDHDGNSKKCQLCIFEYQCECRCEETQRIICSSA